MNHNFEIGLVRHVRADVLPLRPAKVLNLISQPVAFLVEAGQLLNGAESCS